MYGQGNYAPRFGQGSQAPTPPFQQRPVNPHFQQGPPSVTPPLNYSSPFQYQHHPPPPGQHGLPVRVPTNGVPNTPQPYLTPPPGQHGPQVHVSNSATHHYPTAQQNTQWAHNTQRTLPTPPPPGPYRQEMYQPPVPYRASTHTPQPTNQRLPPPPPLPTSSFVSFSPVFSMAPTPPPLPPSSPPPIPPSPPPTRPLSSLGALMPTALHTASEVPHISDSSAKIVATTENMDDTNTADDNNQLADTTSAKVGSSALESLPSEEGAELDLSPPPPKPAEEKVVRKIEVLCRFIAKNGPGFEHMTCQKESANQEFGFLFGGEPGSEAAVAHEYFKWVKKKCILQHKQSNSAVRLPEAATSKQPTPLDADASPSLSDMEMEDDFTQLDGTRCETVFKSEEHVDHEQLGGPQNVIEAIGSTLSLHNEQPMAGDAFSIVGSFYASPAGAAKFVENIQLGVSSSSPHEDTDTIVKPPGELIKGASPFRLLQDYASDESSEHDDKPFVEDAVPVTVPPSTTTNYTTLSRDTLSSSPRDSDPKILPSLELASGEPSESGRAHMCQSNPLNDQESLPKLQIVAEEASTGTVKTEVERSNEHQESTGTVVSPEDVRRKDGLDVVHGSASDERKPQHQAEDIRSTSTLQKVDEFGRLVNEAASDSDPDESHRTRRHGKRRSRSRSRSPNDRRRSRQSPRRRREKRSWSRSSSPRRRRRRSRSPTHRHGVESGGERVRREKDQLPDCFDFLRGRCHRGESCRYMHRGTDKSAGARYNRNTASDVHKEVEKMPLKISINEHDLYGSSNSSIINETFNREEFLVPEQGIIRSAVSDQYDKTLAADVEHGGRKEKSENSVLEKSEAKNQFGVNEPDFNKNASDISNQGDQLKPPAPSTSLPHGTGLPPPHLSVEQVQPPMNYPYQSQFQMQPPHYPMPPNAWPASLPPPPPLQPQFTSNFSAATAIQGVPPPPFQQNQFPPRNDYRMFQDNSHPTATTMDNNARQTYGGQLSSFPLPSLGPLETNNIQSYPTNSFPPSSQSNTYSVQQQPQYGLSQPSPDGFRSGDYGNINTPLRGSKFSLHYNPYASTFDQPFESKINSNVLNQGKDLRYDNSQAVIAPLKTSQAAELPMSGNNQYDPLFDSIEPSSNSFRKSDEHQGLKSTLMLSSSREPLDVGENYKQKEAQTAAISTSVKSNDEFGETADAEVGEVESGKSSNPQDGGHAEVEEVEIDQVKGKKSKDSRSMKLFKSSLADYVKEVLKPHWRQGGMSKEAFKIIVKKTIDKVCGAMKSHHIPKSQEKINRYIDSSERKLNKLVMGYVDKYAKI